MTRLVHSSPGRARFRMRALRDTRLDYRYIRGYLESLNGVSSVRINPDALSVVVQYDPGRLSLEDLKDSVEELDNSTLPRVRDTAVLGRDSDLSPLIMGAAVCAGSLFLPRPAVMLLTLANISDTLRKGVATLATEGVRTEVLDALAVGLSAVRGEYLTANVTQWLLQLASTVESSTRRASDDLIADLLRPQTGTVWVEEADGATSREIPFEDLEEGMIVRVQAGERIPMDGQIVRGLATIDQSAVTGESIPQPKEAGDTVLSGSVVVEGNISVVAHRVGDATTTARIMRFLQDALAEESVTQSKACEIADKRVSITLGLAVAVFLATRSYRRMESVLLIDFACSSKLGTSVAIKSAMARAARSGALVKGGRALEKLAEADTVVFDKTGTLTHNELQVTDVVCLSGTCKTEQDLLALVASIAEHSHHPVACAIVDAARARKLAHMGHEEVAFMIGHGLAANSGSQSVRIGSRHYLEEHEGISFTKHNKVIESLVAEGGKSLLYVGVDGVAHGVIALKDRLRPEAADVLEGLRATGIKRLVMITGDNEATAQALAAELHLDEVHAQVAPEDKAAIIDGLRAQGFNVAYVGDGVNDAPALMSADVGLSMPRGADVARASADLVLLDDSLEGVLKSRQLSLDVIDLIDSNFRMAVGVNSGLLAGAAAGFVPPVLSALLHNGTTLAVLMRAFTGGSWSPAALRGALADVRKSMAREEAEAAARQGRSLSGEP
ncbi:heavy metal translocating P-type ATPase [Phaeovibrio sulfidiphilus]|uniref:P-type Zn(2+) transporter n=1 Tax=Phaeovibrio sulfidiphilus TaxID=1220600 RepID=A0A8J7CS54_9PROT|nr:heavy metal translocating P-type ATPase [Phaeovibrio sulfidiphilus]MBE1237995.1 heavy metal translocating P-type ATPase [Phaeovibrio sulfidiphilus]